MQVLYERCAAVDVGKDVIAVAVRLPVGCQNSATVFDQGFYAARSYSLMRPPRTGRRDWQDPDLAPRHSRGVGIGPPMRISA
jgi:hypothetical protein